MTNRQTANLFLLIGIVAYNFLFWHQKLGINLMVFSSLLAAFAFYLNPKSLYSRNAWVSAVATVITGVCVVIYNTSLSKIMHILSFSTMLGFIHHSEMRSIYYSLLNTLNNFLRAPLSLAGIRKEGEKADGKYSRIRHYLKLAIIPTIVFLVFYFLYKGASPRFAELTEIFIEKLNQLLVHIKEYFSLSWILFILLGLMVIAGIIFNREIKMFLDKDLSFTDALFRVRKKRKKRAMHIGATPANMAHFKTLALKNEHRVGLLLIVMVNLMLLVVNVLDIQWLWFGFTVPDDFSLKQFVHQGTTLLIISILLSIGIILYLFRRNQNFYPGKNLLRPLAYVWMAQNMVLAISVFLRNYHYIAYHGLAFKRIGVVVFLIITAIGIVFMFLKIKQTRSFYFLFRKTSWAAYAVMVITCCINWERIIVNYNLNHWNKGQIDVDFYITMSDRVIPDIMKNLDKVEAQIEAHNKNNVKWIFYTDFKRFKNYMEYRAAAYLEKQERYDWPSWNHADARAYNMLKETDGHEFTLLQWDEGSRQETRVD